MDRSAISRTARTFAAVAAVVALGAATAGCQMASRVSEIGSYPGLSPITNPQAMPGYRPVNLPMPAPQPIEDNPNSLWRPGARAFFKDIRAKDVGDQLTVRMKVNDGAKWDNNTKRTRGDKQGMAVGSIFGFEGQLTKLLPKGADNADLVALNSDTKTSGDGDINRKETMSLTFSAMVTQNSAERLARRPRQSGGPGQLRAARARAHRRHPTAGHRGRQLDQWRADRRDAPRLWRPRHHLRSAAAALGLAAPRHHPAVLEAHRPHPRITSGVRPVISFVPPCRASAAGRAGCDRAPGFGFFRRSTARRRAPAGPVQADDVLDLRGERRIGGPLEGADAVRLQAVGLPDALHRAQGDADHPGDGAAGPVRRFAVVPRRQRQPFATVSADSGALPGLRVLSRSNLRHPLPRTAAATHTAGRLTNLVHREDGNLSRSTF